MKFSIFVAIIVISTSAYAADKTVTGKTNRKPAANITGTVQYSSVGISGQPKTEAGFVITGPAAEALYLDMSLVNAVGDEQEKAGNGVVCSKDTSGKAVCTIDFGNVSKGTLQYDCGAAK